MGRNRISRLKRKCTPKKPMNNPLNNPLPKRILDRNFTSIGNRMSVGVCNRYGNIRRSPANGSDVSVLINGQYIFIRAFIFDSIFRTLVSCNFRFNLNFLFVLHGYVVNRYISDKSNIVNFAFFLFRTVFTSPDFKSVGF